MCGILEHPGDPPKASSVSIWKLSILRWLERQEQVASLTIMQGYFGSQSPKPTKLMITHPSPQLERIMRESRTRETLPFKTSIGKLADGSYATASLKTYPPGLCAALAAAWCSAFQMRTLPCTVVEPPEQFAEAFNSLHSEISEEATHGPDFCTEAQYRPA